LLGEVEDEAKRLQKMGIAGDEVLSWGRCTWAEEMLTWKIMLRDLKMYSKMFILKFGISYSRRTHLSSP
jgi:hypothetical protein